MSESAETTTLSCPKCDAPMRELKAGKAVVDRCERCYGIWIDKGERQKILQDPKSVVGLDIGPEGTGREQNQITEVDCPRCKKRMEHVAHPAQRHVTYEQCPQCGGHFFDAGEITDLSEFTLSERIRSLFGGG